MISLLIAVAIIFYDEFTRKRLDYVWSFIVGTIVHAGIELMYLNAEAVEYQEGSFLGRSVPKWLSVFLRCSQEGGAILIVVLFEGDRVFDCLKGRQKRPLAWRRWIEVLVVFIALSLVSFWSMYQDHQEQPNFGSPDVCSRRLVTGTSQVRYSRSFLLLVFSCFYSGGRNDMYSIDPSEFFSSLHG